MAKTKLDEMIGATLSTMADILIRASEKATIAAATMAAGDSAAETNLAIGTVVGLEDDLETALALYKTALSLHRRNRE